MFLGKEVSKVSSREPKRELPLKVLGVGPPTLVLFTLGILWCPSLPFLVNPLLCLGEWSKRWGSSVHKSQPLSDSKQWLLVMI